MGMGIGVSFQYPMSMNMGMGVIFENKYERGYSSTRLIVIPIEKGHISSWLHPFNFQVRGATNFYLFINN